MSTSEPYLVGEVVVIPLAITNSAGAAADPGALRLKVKKPDDTVTTYTYGVAPEIVKDSVGNYTATIPLPTSGAWYYRWEADTPNPGAVELDFVVKPSRVI